MVCGATAKLEANFRLDSRREQRIPKAEREFQKQIEKAKQQTKNKVIRDREKTRVRTTRNRKDLIQNYFGKLMDLLTSGLCLHIVCASQK